MKTTDRFKEDIQDYLEQVAETDLLFAPMLWKPKKNIDDCVVYILNTVRKSGCMGFTDSEIYGMAAHYYQEDDIEVGESLSGEVIVNRTVELSAEEKAERTQNKAYATLTPLKKRMATKCKSNSHVEQPSLF